MPGCCRLRRIATMVLACLMALATPALAALQCKDEQPTPQVPTDLALCAELDPIVRHPSRLPLDAYEVQLNRFVTAMCHRNAAAGWKMDKTVRDTGPFTATLSPIAAWWANGPASTIRRAPPSSNWIPRTRPRCSMIPVNIGSGVQTFG